MGLDCDALSAAEDQLCTEETRSVQGLNLGGLRTAAEMAWNWTWLIGPFVHDLSGTIQTSPVLLLRPYDVSSLCRSMSWSTLLNEPTGQEVSASPSCPSSEPAVCHLGL